MNYDITLVAVDIGKDGALATANKIYHMPIKKIETKPVRYVFAKDSKGKKILIKSGPNKGQYKQKIKTPAKYSTELDIELLHRTLDSQDTTNRVLAIELPGNTIGNSARSTGTTFMNYGKILAIAELLHYKIVSIPANTWKKHFNLPANKSPTINLAQLERPNETFISERGKLYDGKADACIIYKYYMEKINGNS